MTHSLTIRSRPSTAAFRSRGVVRLGMLTVALAALVSLPSFAESASAPPDLDGSVRITSPGGLILHKRIPAGTDFDVPFRFQVNAPRKGLNKSDLKFRGDISLNSNGIPVLRGQCLEETLRLQGKFYVRETKSTPFGGALVHGRYTAQACRATLVQVLLPGQAEG